MRLSRPFAAVLAVFGLAAAAAGVGWVAGGEIERRVEARARLLADAAGRDWLRVSVDGLRVTLSGAAPDLASARAAVADIAAVDARLSVVDDLTLAPAAPGAAPSAPWDGALDLTAQAGRLRLAGEAPNASARAQLLSALRRGPAGEGAALEDLSRHGRAATPARWTAAATCLAMAAEALAEGRLRLTARGLLIAGVPRDAADRAAVESAAARLADEGWEVTLDLAAAADALSVPAPAAAADAEPWLGLALRDGRLTLSGAAPDAASRAAAVSVAAALFGPDRVENRAGVAGVAAPAGWRAAALTAVEALSALDAGQAVVRGGRVTLGGVTNDPDAADRARAALAPLVAAGWGVAPRLYVEPAAAPAALPPEACAERLAEAIAGGALVFDAGAAALSAGSGPALDRVAAVLGDCGEARVEIGGHTDDRGSAAANRRLGQARAEAVRNALLARGADGGRLSVRGYGAAQPVADNATEEGRALNRRIAFRVEGDGSDGAPLGSRTP